MPKKLLIVESPAKAKTITKYLDNEYKVVASVGHVRDLPKSNKQAIDVDGGFIPHYEISKGKEKVVTEIKKLAKTAPEVLLATDPDREGEAIAWHLKELIAGKSSGSKIKRITYNEITKEAIKEALTHPRGIDEDLRRAQEARRVLDRLVGYDLSGLIWKKVRYGLSAGRVQSPALRIIMEREREIRAFKPITFWTIVATLNPKSQESLLFTCSEEPTEKAEMERIVSLGKVGKWQVTKITETEAKRSPRAPFTTSTLQQTASSRLGFSPSRTMGIAQKLYESGAITYMRTDSPTLSGQALAQATQLIKANYGANYHQPRKFASKSKNAQEAHEAVRPTSLAKENAGNNEDQKKLYQLIWQRTVASQMADAKILRTKISTNIDDNKVPDFNLNGSRVLFDGWLKADPAARGEDVEVPKLAEGDKLDLENLEAKEKQTEPPGRYSEAGLVKELEKRGIGRPSTYASTIKTLIDREYVEKEGRSLVPTDTGDVVSSFLEENFNDYINDSFTAEMEDKLDDIADGKADYAKTLEKIYTPLHKEVEAKAKTAKKITDLGAADPKHKCPVCGSDMIIKLGKTGKFLSCNKFPDCNGARTIDGKELEGPKETGEKCPKCESPLVERDGRYGRFISCGNYPKCKYIKKDASALLNTTGVKCPTCKKGEMVEKRGRFGVFYSCSNYPDCKHAIKAKPTGKKCPECDALMMEGTKTIPERCSDKTCPNHNPHKLND